MYIYIKVKGLNPGESMQMMASAQVVETSVYTNNSPSQDYTTNPDDHSNRNSIYIMDNILRYI